jgi:energy-coupling factor transport system permease protein
VKRPHPASLILLGLVALVTASSRDGAVLFLASLGLGLAALVAASAHLRLLLRRSRWLMLTMVVMFGWFTPGTPLAPIAGASQEGLLLGAESLARLVIALSAVALLLNALSPAELVAGMRSLLAPLALLGISRDRIAVRLALTLEEVEAARLGPDAGQKGVGASLVLPGAVFGTTDAVLGVLAVGLLLGAWLA